MIEIDPFLRAVEREYGLPERSVSGETRVIEELELDSLDLVRLALMIDATGGAELPEGLLLQEDFTLAQVHHYLVVQQGHT